MSTTKLSIQEIAEELALQSKISKRAAEDFLKTLFATVEEALISNDSVKIKDLGTFKVQSVEARKSVNVQTGEEIIIPGYNKVNFAPDADFKELVNKPFAHLEAVVLDEVESDSEAGTLRNFDEQASEIKSIISDIEALSPRKEEHVESIKIKEMENDKYFAQDRYAQRESEDTKKELTEDYDSSLDDEYFKELLAEEKAKRKRRKRWIFFIILFLLILAGACYVFLQQPQIIEKLAFWKKSDTEQMIEEQVAELEDEEMLESTEAVTPSDSIASSAVQVESKPQESVEPVKDEIDALFDTPRVYNEYIATVVLTEGNRLARLAKKYYGDARFWVYIYEANKSDIQNPSDIPTGTSIRIPKLDSRLINASDPRCMKRVKELENIYLGR